MWAFRVSALLGCTLAGAAQVESSSVSSEKVAMMLVKQIAPVWVEPTLLVSVAVCVGILGIVVMSHASGARSSTAKITTRQRMWPVVVVAAFIVHCLWLHEVVLVQNAWHSRDNAVGILMAMSILWWVVVYMYEIWVKKTPLCEDKEDFVAGDVYCDLTVSMFNVAVRFMMQAAMLLIVIHVAQETVDSGMAGDISTMRSIINICIALTIVLYMFVACRDHSSWEDVRRLRGVRAVKLLDCESRCSKDIVYVAPGDFYVRFAMCVVTTGVFHRFLVLSYPLLVFTTFAQDSWVVLLKDILAITVVTQLDNLMRPVSFKVYRNSAAAREDED